MNRATAAGLGAITLWATLALLSRGAAALPPLETTALAFAVSAALGMAWLAAMGRLDELRAPPLAWAHGVGGLCGYHALYFAAVANAPVAQANLVNYLWPLLIVLLSAPLLGMRLQVSHAAGAMLGLAGCASLLLGGAPDAPARNAPLGYALALAAAFTWALYSVLARRFSAVRSGAVAGFCAASAAVAGLGHLAIETTARPDATALASAVALGAGPVGLAFYCWDAGMKRGDPRLLGTLAYAIPVASTLLLCAAGGARPTPALGVAALLVAAGGAIASRGATAPAGRRAAAPARQ